MFEEVKRLGIEPEKWNEFVVKQFENPDDKFVFCFKKKEKFNEVIVKKDGYQKL